MRAGLPWRHRPRRQRPWRQRPWRHRPADQVLAPADAFFLYAETRRVAQTVTAAVAAEASLSRDVLAEHVRGKLTEAPWLSRRLVTRWHGLRRPAWRTLPGAEVDLGWHVATAPVPAPGGPAGLAAFAAGVAARPLPRDRPLWRMWVLPDLGPDRVGYVIAVHHAVCDGPALIELLAPLFGLPARSPGDPPAAPPGARRAAAVRAARGVALLATDGMVKAGPFTRRMRPERRLAVASVPLATVRAAARSAGAQPTDVVLAALGGAVREVRPDAAGPGRALRAAVPVLARTGSTAAQTGNRTAGLWVRVPLDEPDPVRRLKVIAAHRARGSTSDRAAGARFVMERVGGLLPAPLHALAVRLTYRGRFFHTIVSVMPGSRRRARLGPALLLDGYPVLPLAERVGLALGGLVWGDKLDLGLVGDAGVLPDPDRMLAAVLADIERMAAAAEPASPDRA